MEGTSPSRDRARQYLRIAHLFRLGDLPTEQPHPATLELSRWARDDLPKAIEVLKRIDLDALRAMERSAPDIERLAVRVEATLEAGRRIFLCGCGATGRLSLSLEFLWRRKHPGSDRVRSFMAGGDTALVHSLEGFEDYPEHGARHLREMGFVDGDLLISCTEGGETPYVIGATEEAARISSNRPFFLYCNSDSALTRSVERFRQVYRNPGIHRVCLHVGPMALTGSTRMQASTVLQLAVGLALLHPEEAKREVILDFFRQVRDTDFSCLAEFVRKEAAVYAGGHHVTYRVRDFGITVFTDTTERAPTFSLVPFDRIDAPSDPTSLCYVALEEAGTPEEAWTVLLNRAPRSLNWPEVDPRTTPEYLRGFDFSAHSMERRRRLVPDAEHHEFLIQEAGNGIGIALSGLAHDIPAPGMPDLFRHLLLKQMLNIHSTLIMGRLGRYESNLMTWVTPTNGKLVDRAARYVTHLLDRDGGAKRSYEDVVWRLFEEMERARPDESVVLRTYRSLANRRARSTPRSPLSR